MIDRRFLLASLAAVPLAGRAGAQTCAAQGRFEGRVVAEWLGDGRTMRLTRPFSYVDACGKKWSVPPRAKVNGASIPGFLWNEVGPPFVGLYRDASVVHDWYCAVRTEPSLKVHQMFYEAMLASGLSRFRALLMYAGVRLGGPSWDELTIANQRLARVASGGTGSGLGGVIAPMFGGGASSPEAREAAGILRQNEATVAQYRRLAAAIDGGALDFAQVQQIAGERAVALAALRTGADPGMRTTDPEMMTAAPAASPPE